MPADFRVTRLLVNERILTGIHAYFKVLFVFISQIIPENRLQIQS